MRLRARWNERSAPWVERTMRRVAVTALCWSLLPLLGAPPALARPLPLGAPRVVDARARRGEEVRRLFVEAGLPYPAPRLYIRVFKKERVVELWGGRRRGAMVLVRTFPICASSGRLGPKRRQGDGQVPEGFYVIDRFNAYSNFHLSLGIDYPNRSDRIRGRAAGVADLGGDIFIHGECVTIGCIPIENGPIEVLFLAALDTRRAGQAKIPVHVFPARLDEAGMAALEAATEDRSLVRFWRELQPAYLAFERTHRVPRVWVDAQGAYHLR